MMMTLVNSINTEDSDLKLLFKVIANISTNNKEITQSFSANKRTTKGIRRP